MNKNCTGCKSEEKKDLVMVTMSEAAWDRNEERHRKEKQTLLLTLVIVTTLLVITNVCYAIRYGKTPENTENTENQIAASQLS